MNEQQGGCLCGDVRYKVETSNANAITCHCKFCQRNTGTSYLVEICFVRSQFTLLHGEPASYSHVSGGSGKQVHTHFCPRCGTQLFLTFERWTDTLNIFNGTFDDPGWFRMNADNSQHLFLGEARQGTVIPAGIKTYEGHNQLLDGTPLEPVIYDVPHVIGTN